MKKANWLFLHLNCPEIQGRFLISLSIDMSLIRLADNTAYYANPDEGVLISRFDGEFYLEDSLAAKIIFLLYKASLDIADIIDHLSDAYSPVKIMQLVQVMITHKALSENASDKHQSELIQLSEFSISISGGYFQQLEEIKDFSDDFAISLSADSALIWKSNKNCCSSCFRKRLYSNRPLTKFISERRGFTLLTGDTCLPEISHTIYPALDYLCSSDFDFAEVNSVSGETTYTRVIPVPGCKRCEQKLNSVVDFSEEMNSIFHTTKKNAPFRSNTPEQSFDRAFRLVNRYVGIISRLAPYRSLHNDVIHNFVSGRNLAFMSNNRFWLNQHIRSASGGKGRSEQEAKLSALYEAVERYSMVYQGSTPDYQGPVSQHIRMISPASCLNFSDTQYKNNDAANANASSFHQLVPIPFNGDKEHDWYRAESLTHRAPCYIHSHIAYAKPPGCDESELIAYPDSNGCSSGNTYAEAIFQGSLELIERDATAIWWYNRIPRQRINLNSIDSQYVNRCLKLHAELNRALYVLDITTDIEIPCFVAISYDKSSNKGILYGLGCHTRPELAVERAIMEVNQLLPVTTSKRSSSSDQSLYQWLDNESIHDHAYMLGLGDYEQDIQEKSFANPGGLYEGIDHIITRLDHAGVELIAFNLQQRDTNIPVVKMLAPGLRHFWRRTGPGRLYSVPVKMGFFNQPLEETELNPHSITI